MAKLKTKAKNWNCNNICGVNCCSEIFLHLTPEQRVSFDTEGFFIAPSEYSDWRWVGFHKNVFLEKLKDGSRKVSLSPDVEYEIIFNDTISMDVIKVKDKCSKLMSNGKCKVYRARPDICSRAECPVFSTNPRAIWYAKHSILKEAREKVESGELKK